MCIMFRDKWIILFFKFPFCGDFSLHLHKMVQETSRNITQAENLQWHVFWNLLMLTLMNLIYRACWIRRFRKKPEVAWKRGLRALRSSRHLAVNINWINNRSRKSFKMENIEDVKLTPEDIPGASFKDSEICKLTVNQLKFWLKCRRVNQGGNKKVLYERYMLNFKVKFILT